MEFGKIANFKNFSSCLLGSNGTIRVQESEINHEINLLTIMLYK